MRLLLVALLGMALVAVSCGGGGGSVSMPPPPVVAVSITSPTTAQTVQVNATLTITAAVSGTSNTTVTWSVNGVTNGNSTYGTISGSGLSVTYTAPARVPSPATFSITATSQADSTKSTSVSVTISSGVSISISLSLSTVTTGQDGTPGSVTVTVTRPSGNTSSVTLTTSSVPAGVNTQINSPGSSDIGTVIFTPQAPGAPAAGSYPITIDASDGANVAGANLTLVIAVVATLQSTINTNLGKGGLLNTFMSTSFQPAEWDYQFFNNNPEPGTTTLNNLNSQHIRLQPVSQGTPESSQNSWDFSTLDAILNPVISVADKSPESQLAVGPSWIDDPSTGRPVTPASRMMVNLNGYGVTFLQLQPANALQEASASAPLKP